MIKYIKLSISNKTSRDIFGFIERETLLIYLISYFITFIIIVYTIYILYIQLHPTKLVLAFGIFIVFICFIINDSDPITRIRSNSFVGYFRPIIKQERILVIDLQNCAIIQI